MTTPFEDLGRSGLLLVALLVVALSPAGAEENLDELLGRQEPVERSEEAEADEREATEEPPAAKPTTEETEEGRRVEQERGVAPPADPPPEAVRIAPVPRPRQIEEIVVTAQKKEEALQDVPISITAMTGEFLGEAGIQDIPELVEFVPNARVNRASDGPHVFIRGFGTPFGPTSFEPAVGLTVDELPLGQMMFISEPLYDIERFEVLRGPQGILFGKNTSAGLFNVTTRKPTDEYTGYLTGRIGQLGQHNVEAAIGGPLGQVAQFRLSVLESRLPGDVHNTKLGVDEPDDFGQRAGRIQLGFQPAGGFDFLLLGERAVTQKGTSQFPDIQPHGFPDDAVEFLRQYDPEFEDDGFDHQTSMDVADGATRTSYRLQGNARYSPGDLGPVADADFVLVLGWTGFDENEFSLDDQSPADIIRFPDRKFLYDQRSAELRFSGFVPAPFRFGEIEFLAGFLYFESEIPEAPFTILGGEDIEEYLVFSQSGVDLATIAAALGIDLPAGPSPLLGDGGRISFDQDARSEAGFGRVAWHLNEQWTASFGARVTFEQKEASFRNVCFDPGALCAALGIEEFENALDREETDFSPQVTLQYFPFDDLSLFATRATGFKAGGFNNINFTNDPERIEVDKETAVSWETGVRGTLLGGALSYGGTFFNMEVEDLQLQRFEGGSIFTTNAASARSRGIELEFQWLTPWEPLSFRGAASLTDGVYKSFPDAPPPDTSEEESQDLSGRRLPFVPKRQVTITPELRFPIDTRGWPLLESLLPAGFTITTALDAHYRSDMFLNIDLDPRMVQDDFVKLDPRLRLSNAEETFSLDVFVKNATDVDVAETYTNSLLFSPGLLVRQEFQRHVVGGLTYRW